MSAVAENIQTEMPTPILFTDSAAAKVADLIAEEGNPELKLRVFVQGGGCSGFQYGFTFDEITNEDDTTMTKNGVSLLIDAMSYQYLLGAEIDRRKVGLGVLAFVRVDAERNNAVIPRGHVLEFGCGTGRITPALAGAFETVTAVDVSSGHLALCQEALLRRGVNNVSCFHLDSLPALASLLTCSFLLSTIVLQHNPPPLIAYLLDWLLSKVEPGGAALFQVPTHTPGYEFDVNKYLASPAPKDFEMHCIPMHHVFALLHRHGFAPREVIMDTWTGMPGSHTFFATKS